MDIYIKNLLADILREFRIDTKPNGGEVAIVINEQFPILLKYDSARERMLVIASIDLEQISDMDRFYQQASYSALSSLNDNEPLVGLDEKSQHCFSYLVLSRAQATSDLVCKEVIRLIEWNQQFIARC